VRGSPLLRALFAFCLIAALGWPLWHLTRPTEVEAGPVVAPPSVEAKAIGLQLTFTIPPKSFAVRYLEKDIWAESAPQASMEREIPLVFPEKGVDLVFHIEWPDDAPLAAARVRLTDPAGDTHEKSVWGQGAVDEVLTFP
jgi:hypothetical protein